MSYQRHEKQRMVPLQVRAFKAEQEVSFHHRTGSSFRGELFPQSWQSPYFIIVNLDSGVSPSIKVPLKLVALASQIRSSWWRMPRKAFGNRLSLIVRQFDSLSAHPALYPALECLRRNSWNSYQQIKTCAGTRGKHAFVTMTC